MTDLDKCLFTGVLLFGISVVLLLALSWSKMIRYYFIYVQNACGVQITWLLFVSYFLMYTKQSFIVRIDDAQVYWIRYAIYALAFGLSSQRLALEKGLPKGIALSFARFIMLGFALIAWATVVAFNGRWYWFAIGTASICFGLVKIYVNCLKCVEEWSIVSIYMPLLWLAYPTIWALGEAGSGEISDFVETLLYLILDAIVFCIFNINLHVYMGVIKESANSSTTESHYHPRSKASTITFT